MKLDIEKTRLLVWGNELGIFTLNQQHYKLRDEEAATLLTRILRQIEKLLTDSEVLRSSYGLTTQESSQSRTVDFLSSESFKLFRISSKRFWTRNALRLNSDPQLTRGGVLTKTKWAIYAKERFQGLVNDVKDFIDNLYELVPIERETQERIIKEDIEDPNQQNISIQQQPGHLASGQDLGRQACIE